MAEEWRGGGGWNSMTWVIGLFSFSIPRAADPLSVKENL